MRHPVPAIAAVGIIALVIAAGVPLSAQTDDPLVEGKAAFGDWHADSPGTRRLIRPQDLPAPDFAESVSNRVTTVHRDEQKPSVPAGFSVSEFASGLEHPRLIRRAPNGDIFVAESAAGRIRVLRPDGARARQASVFASDLLGPFGIAFYPPGPNPQWVYVGNTDSVVRFPYRNGDLIARGPAETIVPHLPVGGHRTRDVVFSPNGQTMFVSVGSGSNVADDMEKLNGAALQTWMANHPLGATWGPETDRADVLTFDPQGKRMGIFATGIRNCVGMAIDPSNGTLWCSTNERDRIGNNLPPDYVTRVREGAFYGWPWYYIGANTRGTKASGRTSGTKSPCRTCSSRHIQLRCKSLSTKGSSFPWNIAAISSPPNTAHGTGPPALDTKSSA
jgi:hypothetical protein